ncbi:MAG: inositol monophosphatase [Candidatus Coatesbacteria bacterium]|nr:MAG: inositol monophosphatase [Candidatus Coatesbacteria bacterium]
MTDYGDYAAFGRRLAGEAAALIADNFLGTFAVDRKGATNLVTEVDRRSEELLVEAIGREFPGHAVVAEEGSARPGGEGWRWYVDPLDGTNNFAHGYPMVAVSLALERDGELVVGVVADALREEVFWTERGGGAWNGGARLAVSAAATLGEALVATGFPYDKHASPVDNVANFGRVTKLVRGIRRGGSAALDLAYVAAGRLDGFWELKLSPWDTAAGVLLVAEAGGAVSRLDGSAYRPGDVDVVATNGVLHEELRRQLRLEG